MTLAAVEFIRSSLLHVLPGGFMKILALGISGHSRSHHPGGTSAGGCWACRRLPTRRPSILNHSLSEITASLLGDGIAGRRQCRGVD